MAQESGGAKELLKQFLSGGVAGISLVLAGHPFDLVKTRLQTAPAGTYSGALDVVRKTVARDGARGLFRGMAAPLYGVTPIFALCFAAYGAGKDLMRSVTGARTNDELSLTSIGIAGALSAVPTTAIMAPGERIKVLLATSGQAQGGVSFKGPGDVVRHLVRTEGAASLFRGSLATLLRDGVGSFAYFAAYEGIKRHMAASAASAGPDGEAKAVAAKPSALAIVAGGAAAGVANWLVALPFDVVKSRIQASVGGGGKPPGTLAVARALIAAEGVAGLYRGIGPALLRAVPANAAAFLGQETSRSALDKMF